MAGGNGQRDSPRAGRGVPASAFETFLFGLGVLAVGFLLLYVLVKIWPVVPHGSGRANQRAGFTEISLFWDLVTFHLNQDTALVVLVGIMGMLGSLIFIGASFSDYVGNQRFERNWMWFYVVRILTGPGLALVFYFALRGGFLVANSQASDVNPYGVAALAGLVGMFSKQASDKLHQLFDALFQVDSRYGDDTRGGSLANPAPTITAIDPKVVKVGPDVVDLKITGMNFVDGSSARVSTSETASGTELVSLETVYKDATSLEVKLDAEHISEPGVLFVSVLNPDPGGGISGPYRVEISADETGAGTTETTDVAEGGPPQPQPEPEPEPEPEPSAKPPVLTDVSPQRLPQGFAEHVVTLTGERLSGVSVLVAPPTAPGKFQQRPTGGGDDSSIRVILTGDDAVTPGTLQLVADNAGGRSNRVNLAIG